MGYRIGAAATQLLKIDAWQQYPGDLLNVIPTAGLFFRNWLKMVSQFYYACRVCGEKLIKS
jgi:hypothetical protein